MGAEWKVLDEVTFKIFFAWEAPWGQKSKASTVISTMGNVSKIPSRHSPGDRPQPL